MAGEVRAEQVNLTSAITTNPTNMYVESNNDGFIKKIAISNLVYRRNETYSRSETDTKLAGKQDIMKPIKISDVKGSNSQIRTITYDGNKPLTISAGNNISFAGCNADTKDEFLTISATDTNTWPSGGTTSQYWRGDGTWGTPPDTVGGGGGGGTKFYYNYINNMATADAAKKTCEVNEVIVSYIAYANAVSFGGSGTYIFLNIGGDSSNGGIRYGSSWNAHSNPSGSTGTTTPYIFFCFRVN